MKISYNELAPVDPNADEVPAITSFTESELPQIAILTGLNGSGKTSLLKGLQTGKLTLEGNRCRCRFLNSPSIDRHVAVYDSGATGSSGLEQVAWASLEGIPGHLTTELYPAYSTALEEITIDRPGGSEDDRKRRAWEITLKNKQYRPLILRTLERMGWPPPPISKNAFIQYFARPIAVAEQQYATHFRISFSQYARRRHRWAIGQVEQYKGDIDSYKRRYEEEIETPIWRVVNEALSIVHSYSPCSKSFDFRFEEPDTEDIRIESIDDYFCNTRFVCTLPDGTFSERPKFDSLSSGEKTLLAFILMTLESDVDDLKESVLLLDEIDQTLHPSMTRALLGIVEDVLSPRYKLIMLATHSPSTVALATEGSVFLVEKDESGKIGMRPTGKREAIESLTEGFATLASGEAIFSQIADATEAKVIVISEGHNCDYIERACRLFGVQGVHVVKGLRSLSGSGNLRALFTLCQAARMQKPVVFVWDPDCYSELVDYSDGHNVFKHVLPGDSSNTTFNRGVENVFNNKLLTLAMESYVSSQRSTESSTKINSRQKNHIRSFVLDRATKEDFRGFGPLMALLEEKVGQDPPH